MKDRWDRKRVKALRARLALTQEEFATKLGVSRLTVQRWERREKPCRPSRMACRLLSEAEENGVEI